MNESHEVTLCQSCGMQMDEPALYGTDKDGSSNDEYCAYCYKDGVFTDDMTLEEMIDLCAGPMVEYNPDKTLEQAKEALRLFLPTLKRWQ